MRVRVYITYRPSILDPQGNAVARSLVALGYDEVRNVRVGKLIDIELAVSDRPTAERRLDEMCHKILANPVIEDFRYEVLDGTPDSRTSQRL